MCERWSVCANPQTNLTNGLSVYDDASPPRASDRPTSKRESNLNLNRSQNSKLFRRSWITVESDGLIFEITKLQSLSEYLVTINIKDKMKNIFCERNVFAATVVIFAGKKTNCIETRL